MRGAIREDDYRKASFPCVTNPPNPQEGVTVDRPVNHFYDPINDQSLGIGSAKAFDWALGTANALTDGNAPEADRDNHYTVFDAREALFRALTGMNGTGSRAIGAGGSTPSSASDKDAVRKAYWATTFRALGDLVHLIQDMAQPQHTRADPHLTECPDAVRAVLGGKSVYEDYVDARATGSLFELPGNIKMTPPPLVYVDPANPYPIPRFNDYVSYFTTQHVQPGSGDAAVLARRGLADYSNRGFFTARTNFNTSSPRYDLPPSDLTAYGTETVTTDWTGRQLPGGGATLLTHSVVDSYAPGHSRAQVPLTTLSVWDGWLQNRGFAKRYRLNRYNYDAMADLLIPRAVAYSAGLIDYFFRGRMEIALPDEGVYAILDHAVEDTVDEGFRRVKLKLSNATPAINDGANSYPQAMTGGTLWAVVKFQRNGCYQPDLSGEPGLTSCDITANRGPEEIVVSDPIAVQSLDVAPQPFTFEFQNTPIPVNAVNVVLQVVYRGELGSERDAVVVATRDISEPTFISFINVTGARAYRFNFGGGMVGRTDLPDDRGSRIGVLPGSAGLRIYIYQEGINKWLSGDIPNNRHRFDVATNDYDVYLLGAGNQHWDFIQHWAFIHGTVEEGIPYSLDNLSPYPAEIYF